MFELLEGAAGLPGRRRPRSICGAVGGAVSPSEISSTGRPTYTRTREAFVDRQTRLTYAQARENAERLAIGLMDLGIKPLDRVMIQLPNWTEFVTVYFACQKIGVITVMLIDRYRQHEIQRLAEIPGGGVGRCRPQYGKTDYLPVVDDVRAGLPGHQIRHHRAGEVDAPGSRAWSG